MAAGAVFGGLVYAMVQVAVLLSAAVLGVLLGVTRAAQRPFQLEVAADKGRASDRVLSGRFLHVTDVHVDHQYREGSSVVSACHHDHPYHRHGGEWRAGHWGTGVSDCDAPPELANATLRWITDNWDVPPATGTPSVAPTHMFDFIIWTGDSARHDSDTQIPRTAEEVFAENAHLLHTLESYFPGVPLVPTVGNNDVGLHNTFAPGPSDETRRFAKLWSKHLPASSIDSMKLGGYYAKDVVENELGVVSLNTMYFFDSNKAVDGCPRRHRSDRDEDVDAGTLQLEWMARELLRFRRRDMQVHIVGHVPPTAGNYFPRCYDAYTELVLRFQDTIVGQHFGHMNLDAFFVQESAVVAPKLDAGAAAPEPSVQSDMRMIEKDLRYDYAELPGPARTDMDYYGAFNLAPSVVPAFSPSVRVWTYNTTPTAGFRPPLADVASFEGEALQELLFGEEDEEPVDAKRNRSHKRPQRRHRRRHRKQPRYTSAQAPARTNTYLTPLGYSQWVLDIDRANDKYTEVREREGRRAANKLGLEYALEYTTFAPETLWHEYLDVLHPHTEMRKPRPHENPAEHHVPVPRKLLDRHLATHGLETPYRWSNSSGKYHLFGRLTPLTRYALHDMTLGSVMNLARRLAISDSLWALYVDRLYTSSIRTQP